MYYPLEFAETASYELFYEIYKQFYNNDPKEDLKDAEENFKLIDCMYSEEDKDYYSAESFLKSSESVKLHEYGKAFVKYADILFDKEESPLRDLMELFMMNTIVNEWKKSKQVYTIKILRSA